MIIAIIFTIIKFNIFYCNKAYKSKKPALSFIAKYNLFYLQVGYIINLYRYTAFELNCYVNEYDILTKINKSIIIKYGYCIKT